MKIYISGKITGIEQQALALFAKAEAFLKEQGYEPINPMALPHLHDQQWHSYMREDIKALCACDAIYMLHNWQGSKGARLEHEVAQAIGLKIFLNKTELRKSS
jgi:hypothetical protein